MSVGKIVAVSKFTREALKEWIEIADPDRISLIENGVDNKRFRPQRSGPI
jgi:hypothetical protein